MYINGREIPAAGIMGASGTVWIHTDTMKGLHEVLEDVQGKRTLRLHGYSIVPIPEYSAEDIRNIRNGQKMSQAMFAGFLGVSLKTVESWESGHKSPGGPARRILYMIQMDLELPEKYSIIKQFKELTADD